MSNALMAQILEASFGYVLLCSLLIIYLQETKKKYDEFLDWIFLLTGCVASFAVAATLFWLYPKLGLLATCFLVPLGVLAVRLRSSLNPAEYTNSLNLYLVTFTGIFGLLAACKFLYALKVLWTKSALSVQDDGYLWYFLAGIVALLLILFENIGTGKKMMDLLEARWKHQEDITLLGFFIGVIVLFIVVLVQPQIKFQSNLSMIGIIFLVAMIAMILESYFKGKYLVLTLLGSIFVAIGCGIAIAAISYIGIPILELIWTLLKVIGEGWQFLIGFIVLGIFFVIGGAYQEELAEFFLELVVPMVLILAGGTALLWVGGWLVGVSYANWNTVKWVYLAGMVGFIGYTIWNLEFRNDVLGVVALVVCFGGGLYALKSIVWQSKTSGQRSISAKTVPKEIENQEIKKVNQNTVELKKEFMKSFEKMPETSLFRKKNITYIDPSTNKPQSVQLIPEFSFERVKNRSGEPVDTVAATYSYLIVAQETLPSVQGGTLEREFIDYPPGRYHLSDSKTALELMGAVKQSIDSFLKPYLERTNKVKITITGWADSIPITGKLVYELEAINQFYFIQGQPTPIPILLSKGSIINTNEVLAFVRSLGAKNFLEEYTQLFNIGLTKKQYIHQAVAYRQNQGGSFRKVQIRLDIHNPQLSPAPPTNPSVSELSKECWLCKFLNLWISGGIMALCFWLFKWHHQKIKDAKTNIGYHKNWRNGSIIVALIATLLYAFC